jgi:hypothetical protein
MIHSPGQDLAPSPPWRVASGLMSLISRHFFINQTFLRGIDLEVLLPNNVSNIVQDKSIIKTIF